MTTSLAALAASAGAHSPSTCLMSSSTMSATNSLSAANLSSSQANSTGSSNALIDAANYDTNYEIKTEFYTREGLWKLMPQCEYVKMNQAQVQQQQQQIQSQMQSQQGQSQQLTNQMNSPNSQMMSASNLNAMTNNSTPLISNVSNDPVKLFTFKFSKATLTGVKNSVNANARNRTVKRNLKNQSGSKNVNTQQKKQSPMAMKEAQVSDVKFGHTVNKKKEHDDDDDIVFNSKNKLIMNESNQELNDTNDVEEEEDRTESDDESGGDTDGTGSIHSKNNKGVRKRKSTKQSLDLILFNYSREIYFYEFNRIESSRVLIDATLN
jgi:hypothetical protein